MGSMNRLGGQTAPWWLTMQLWGLDVPVAAFCWGLSFAILLGIPMIIGAPLLLLVSAAWCITLGSRLYNAVRQNRGWCVHFYRSHVKLLSLLTLALAASTVWILLFHVGQVIFAFAYKPLALSFLGFLPYAGWARNLRRLFHAMAFAQACALPAAYCCMDVMPRELWIFLPIWFLAVLMYLYYLVRSSWEMEEADARRRSAFVSVGLMLLVLTCLLGAATAPFYERPLCFTVATGAVFLGLLVLLRPRLSETSLFSFGWLTMALPPVLGMFLF